MNVRFYFVQNFPVFAYKPRKQLINEYNFQTTVYFLQFDAIETVGMNLTEHLKITDLTASVCMYICIIIINIYIYTPNLIVKLSNC